MMLYCCLECSPLCQTQDAVVQRMTLRSIFWPGGGKGGRAPLGCPLAFSFSILSLTCIQHKACLIGTFTPINHRNLVSGQRVAVHFALVAMALATRLKCMLDVHACLKPLCLAPCQPNCKLRQLQSS